MSVKCANPLWRRWTGFIVGLWLASVGLALIIKASLGVSPVASFPYILSLAFPLTFGFWVACEQIFLVLSQILILRRRLTLKQFLQLPTAVLFGLFCDASLWLINGLTSTSYIGSLSQLLIGIVLLASGLCIQLSANVLVGAQEGFMLAVAQAVKSRYSRVKMVVDWFFVALSAIASWSLLGGIYGIGEGTLITALGVGSLVGLLMPHMSVFLKKYGVDGRSGSQQFSILN